ncbi:3-deoxy-manno-octulosonate cytidylyltransferase [Sporosarcina sp. SAFN-015]|uniref:3-deoxy-manno-octulosonate cytidylyltransferase n=1 Tax=Sporosarcina sp. SAFN-015 TaxID=3387274 RepID=UPI003F823A43
MDIVCIIPARYNSSRFKGKPLADICGKPMIWWVYNQAKKVKEFSEVYVATDNDEIEKVCQELGINTVMTSNNHPTSTQRVNEVSKKIQADLYVVINGDEPLIQPDTIKAIIPETFENNRLYVANLMTKIKSQEEVEDNTNIKVVTDHEDYALYFSRNPIPFRKNGIEIEIDYYKHLGVLVYNAEALEFFANTPKGNNELVEDVNELRFVEHGQKIKMIEVESDTLSVDVPNDLEVVKNIIEERIKAGMAHSM